MADGYIENRMAERHSPARPAGNKARRLHALSGAMPPRRVLISTTQSQVAEEIARTLAEAGCRVAVTFPALSSGYRMVTTSADSLPEFEPLLHAWHDIDMLITDLKHPDEIDALFKAIDHARQVIPTPNPTDIRTVILTGGKMPNNATHPISQLLLPSSPTADIFKAAAATCLFLAMPASSPIENVVVNLSRSNQ